MRNGEFKKRVAIGCSIVGLLVLATAGTIVAVTALAIRGEQLSEPSVRHTMAAGAGSVVSGQSVLRPVATTPEPAGIVTVIMGTGQLFIEVAEPGEALTVEASYDTNYYRFNESFVPGTPWTYHVALHRTGSTFIAGLKEAFGGNQPHVRIRLPRNIPIRLELDVRSGFANVDVGGLSLTSAEFDFNGSVLDFDVSEPPPFVPDEISVQGRRGVLLLRGLGKASPRRLNVDFRVGELQVDLRGNWVSDSQIDLDIGMSDVLLRLPRNVRVEGLETQSGFASEPAEIEQPILKFSLTTGVRGSIKVFE